MKSQITTGTGAVLVRGGSFREFLATIRSVVDGGTTVEDGVRRMTDCVRKNRESGTSPGGSGAGSWVSHSVPASDAE